MSNNLNSFSAMSRNVSDNSEVTNPIPFSSRNVSDNSEISDSTTSLSPSPSYRMFREQKAAINKENSTNEQIHMTSSPAIASYWTSAGVPRLDGMPTVDFLSDAVLIVRNPDFIIVECNDAAVKIFGYTNREELLGKNINILVPLEYAAHNKQMASVFSNMQNRDMGKGRRVYGLRAGGTKFEVSIQLCPAIIQVKGFQHYEKIVACLCRDITQHNISVEARSEANQHALIDSVLDYAIFRMDVNGIVSSWNTGAERLKGYSAEEIVGKHFSAFYTDADITAGKPKRELQIAKEQGRFEEDGIRKRKDGSLFWANVIISAIRDKTTGELLGFSKVTRDLSEKKQVEHKSQPGSTKFPLLQSLSNELELAEKMLSDIINRLESRTTDVYDEATVLSEIKATMKYIQQGNVIIANAKAVSETEQSTVTSIKPESEAKSISNEHAV